MNPTHFRAYGLQSHVNRRVVTVEDNLGNKVTEKQNVTDMLHDVIAEGDVVDNVATFNADVDVTRVVFYFGEGDNESVAGVVDEPIPAGRKRRAVYVPAKDEVA